MDNARTYAIWTQSVNIRRISVKLEHNSSYVLKGTTLFLLDIAFFYKILLLRDTEFVYLLLQSNFSH